MKKRCRAGRNVCERKTVSVFFFVVLFFPFIILAQKNKSEPSFPLFAVETYKTTPGNNKIAIFNIDDIPPYDIIFYGNGNNEFTFHSSENLSRAKRKFFFFPISEIKQIKHSKSPDGRFYIFTSRKKNLVGIASFTKYGTLRLLNKRAIADYPENILVGNFLGNPSLRALVFGGAFEGVTLFSLEDFILKEKKVIASGSFTEGGLLDLDADGMNDLVLYNALEKKSLFYLNLLNKFEITFAENAARETKNLKTLDINGDKLIDYAYISDGKIILNEVNSNPQNRFITELSVPNCVDYEFSDFSFDYRKDLIWLDDNGNIFYKLKTDGKFTPNVFLATLAGASAINTVWNKTKREIIVLSFYGTFMKLSPVNRIEKSISLLPTDLRKNSEPLISAKNNAVAISWLSQTYPKIYTTVIYSSGEIQKKETPLPFFPDNILIKNENVFLVTNNDSLTIYRELKNYLTPVTISTSEAEQKIFAFPDRHTVTVLPDTYFVPFDFSKLIFVRNSRFLFTDSNKVILSVAKKDTLNLLVSKKIEPNEKIHELYDSGNAFFAVSLLRNSLKIFGPDSTLRFRCNKNFAKKTNLTFFLPRNSDYLYAYDKNGGNIYSARLNFRQNYLKFSKNAKNVKLEKLIISIINNKPFAVGVNKQNGTVDFVELK